jgi:hypothetical protein
VRLCSAKAACNKSLALKWFLLPPCNCWSGIQRGPWILADLVISVAKINANSKSAKLCLPDRDPVLHYHSGNF